MLRAFPDAKEGNTSTAPKDGDSGHELYRIALPLDRPKLAASPFAGQAWPVN